MGRPKKELKIIHRKKRKQAKIRAGALLKGEISLEGLNVLSRKFLGKRRKKKPPSPDK